MFCAACGAPNDDNAFRCTVCGKKLLRPGDVISESDEDPGVGPVAVPIVLAAFTALFCCQPAGIVAVVFAALAMGRNSAGAYSEARRHAETARKWAWAAFGVGLTIQLIYLAIVLTGVLASKAAKP